MTAAQMRTRKCGEEKVSAPPTDVAALRVALEQPWSGHIQVIGGTVFIEAELCEIEAERCS
jgi:hypothetical protein